MDKYKIKNLDYISKDILIIETEKPNKKILAGQCFSIGVPGMGINREYSIYSGENDSSLSFLVRIVDDGIVTSELKKLNVGDEIEINGPFGAFTLTDYREFKYLFLASGTGVAPFHSFYKSYKNLNFTLLHGFRYENESKFDIIFPKDSYIKCISKPSNGRKGQRITDFLLNNDIEKFKDHKIYLCGNRNMINDCIEILKNKKVPGNNIFTEVFF